VQGTFRAGCRTHKLTRAGRSSDVEPRKAGYAAGVGWSDWFGVLGLSSAANTLDVGDNVADQIADLALAQVLVPDSNQFVLAGMILLVEGRAGRVIDQSGDSGATARWPAHSLRIMLPPITRSAQRGMQESADENEDQSRDSEQYVKVIIHRDQGGLLQHPHGEQGNPGSSQESRPVRSLIAALHRLTTSRCRTLG